MHLFNVFIDGKEKVVSVAKLDETVELINLAPLLLLGFTPGTFDPVTFGHLDIIIRATHIVNKLIVSVAENTHTKALSFCNSRED